MHTVGHHFDCTDCHAAVFGGLNDRFLEPFVNRRGQNLPTILRTPHVQAENRPGIGSTLVPASLRQLKQAVSRGEPYDVHNFDREFGH
jgi:hypothetical protein